MTNSYFNFETAHNEQDLYENMVIESIQIYGMDIQYCPKTLVDYDALLGEDAQRAFKSAHTIEIYFENVDGFLGEKLFLNNFGENIDKQISIQMAKRRFDEVMLGLNWRYYWESRDTYATNDALHWNGLIYKSIVSSNKGNQPDTSPSQWVVVDQVRPYEGDLIYLPLTGDIFEILFVDHEEVFYQLGKIYVWKLTCEKFRYSHEKLKTGITAIDDIATELENNGSVVNDPIADNITIDTQIDDFLNLDPHAPF